MKAELRRYKRYLVSRSEIRVSWLNREGQVRVADVKVFNISERGLSVSLPEPLARFSVLKLKSVFYSLDGTAVVRNCRFGPMRSLLGLELLAPAVLTPPPEPASAPSPLSGTEPLPS